MADTLPCRYHLVLPFGQVEVHRLVLFVGVLATSIAIILFAVGASADAHAYAVQPQICLYLQTYVAPPLWPPDMDPPPNTHTYTHTRVKHPYRHCQHHCCHQVSFVVWTLCLRLSMASFSSLWPTFQRYNKR